MKQAENSLAAPKLTGDFNQQVDEVYNLIVSRISKKYGEATAKMYANAWRTYADKHKGQGTVGQLYLAWFLNESNLPQKLGTDIATGLKTAAGVAGAIPQNINAASPTQLIGGIWGTLTSKALWVRIGEGIAAIILLDVGLKAFTNKSVIETVAKKTPGGRLIK